VNDIATPVRTSLAPQVTLAEKVRALASPYSYPENADRVEVIETHFAWVFLVGQHAYKMKKPIKQPLLDLRSMEARRANCEEELRLNRRIAPDVYLGVVPLALGENGQLRVAGVGAPVDWLVCMKRLPSDSMLDRAIIAGSVPVCALTSVGSALAKFYSRQARFVYKPEEYIARLQQQIEEEEIALRAPELKLPSARIRVATAAMSRALAEVRVELGQRAVEGRIVDAHGDLRPEHICLCDPPCIIDSLEFSRELRKLDIAEELAFLVLECKVAGNEGAGLRIVQSYCEESGDSFSDRVLNFYRGTRAMVRAKITAWHLRDPAVMSVAPWGERACAYIDLAEEYARHALGRH
jgi:aminoglycoside phosphotransferase family enzyme